MVSASSVGAAERIWTRVGDFGDELTDLVSTRPPVSHTRPWHRQPRPPRFSAIAHAERVYPLRERDEPFADGLFHARYTVDELASAVYAETGGLYPAKVRPGSVYDVSTYLLGDGPGSEGDLRRARMMVAETRKLNKKTHMREKPRASDRLSMRVWEQCYAAAEAVMHGEFYPLKADERLHFFIRQEGVGRRTASYLKGFSPVASYGPFINVGGGDVPPGPRTYIDFYVLPTR